jgi:Transglutaminase-like superfamily
MYYKFLLIIVLIFCIKDVYSQYPVDVQVALQQTKTNKSDLKKSLDYFYKSGDSLKIKSINFLVANMPIHYTANYFWATGDNQRIAYSELNYTTFNEAVTAFNELKIKYGKLHPVPYTYRDIDSIKADYLIQNVEQACSTWQSKHNKFLTNSDWVNFSDYVLPYRVDVEATTIWRNAYANKFNNSFTNNATTDSIKLRQLINSSFKNLWGTELQNEPLPRLSAMQILLRGKGYCEDIADMAVFIARSQGVAASVDNVPAWATTTGKHFTNYLQFDSIHKHFDAVLDSLGREPGKVLRTTYSLQSQAIASWLDTAYIPNGFMRLKNYTDVTNEYWQTADFTINLTANAAAKAVFVGVLNGGRIVPVWFAKKEDGKAIFKNMGKGVVYFPFYFFNNTMLPAGNPFALGYNNAKELKPDTLHKHTIVIKEQEKYLKYRTGKHYQLLIWDKQWTLHSTQVASDGCTQLLFNNVPQNALLLLVPEYSQGKERPFIIEENGERIWW